MSRFTPDRESFFDSIYEGVAPWDIQRAQPALAALFDEFPPTEPVLDVGCGTGDLAIELAQRGLRVVGIDLAEAALSEAMRRAAEAGDEIAARIEFLRADALHPSLLRRRFGAVVDSGFLHVLETDQRTQFVDELARVLVPGGRYYLQAFTVDFPLPNTPIRVTQEEVRDRFGDRDTWRILALREAEFLSRIQPVPAIVACVERLPWRAEDDAAPDAAGGR